jgi:hypothetical protein
MGMDAVSNFTKAAHSGWDMNSTHRPIAHIVSWRLNGQDQAEKMAQAIQIKQAFNAMKSQVPGLNQLEVGHNMVDNPDAWDVSAYMVFDSLQSLVEYQSHPAHLEIKKLVGPMRLERCQVDFELSNH